MVSGIGLVHVPNNSDDGNFILSTEDEQDIFEDDSDLDPSYHLNEPSTSSARLNLSGNSNGSNMQLTPVSNAVNRQVLSDSFKSESDDVDRKYKLGKCYRKRSQSIFLEF